MSRHTRRGPGHRANTLPLLNTAPLALELHGTIVAGGSTTVQMTCLGIRSKVVETTDPAVLAQITLTGIIDGVTATVSCDSITNAGDTGLGTAVLLEFTGELSETQPFEVQIPYAIGLFGNSAGGKAAGTLSGSQVALDVPGGYLRLSNIVDLPSLLTSLMWPISAEVTGQKEITIETNASGNSPFVFDGVPPFAADIGGAATAVADGGAGLLVVTFTSAVSPDSTVSLGALDPTIRGASEEWMAPLQITANRGFDAPNLGVDSPTTVGAAAASKYASGGFWPVASATLLRVTVPLTRVGNPSMTIIASIWSNNAGNPNAMIGTPSAAFATNTLPTGETYVTFELSAAVVTGTEYHLVLNSSAQDAANYTTWRRTTKALQEIRNSTDAITWVNVTTSQRPHMTLYP